MGLETESKKLNLEEELVNEDPLDEEEEAKQTEEPKDILEMNELNNDDAGESQSLPPPSPEVGVSRVKDGTNAQEEKAVTEAQSDTNTVSHTIAEGSHKDNSIIINYEAAELPSIESPESAEVSILTPDKLENSAHDSFLVGLAVLERSHNFSPSLEDETSLATEVKLIKPQEEGAEIEVPQSMNSNEIATVGEKPNDVIKSEATQSAEIPESVTDTTVESKNHSDNK